MVNSSTTHSTSHTTSHTKKDDDDDNKTSKSKEVKEEIATTPEHTFKEIEGALRTGNNRDQILDYIVDALGGLQSNSLSDIQKTKLKETVNKNLLNKLD